MDGIGSQCAPQAKRIVGNGFKAVALGIVVGYFWPDFGKSLKPLGDGFVKLVKMMIAPIIFCTVVHGIASMGDLKKLGRVWAKTLLYFEIV